MHQRILELVLRPVQQATFKMEEAVNVGKQP
jgi:hypothetical protein